MHFWDQIRGAVYSACINKGVSQKEIGRRSGMDPSTINAFMKRPNSGLTPKNLDGLLRALNLRVEVVRK